MTDQEFKVGDRVVAIDKVDGVGLKGKTGKVLVAKAISDFIDVEFDDKFPEGHSSDSLGKFGHCRCGEKTAFKLAKGYKQPPKKAPTHIVVWDEGCGDPAKFFTDEKEARDFAKKLTESDKNSNIILAEVSNVKAVNVEKKLKYTKHLM